MAKQLSVDSKVKDIIRNEAAAAVWEEYFPGASTHPQMKLCYGMTLRKVLSFPQVACPQETIDEIDARLKAIGQ